MPSAEGSATVRAGDPDGVPEQESDASAGAAGPRAEGARGSRQRAASSAGE